MTTPATQDEFPLDEGCAADLATAVLFGVPWLFVFLVVALGLGSGEWQWELGVYIASLFAGVLVMARGLVCGSCLRHAGGYAALTIAIIAVLTALG